MIVAEFGDSKENGVLTNAVGASVKAINFILHSGRSLRDFLNVWWAPSWETVL